MAGSFTANCETDSAGDTHARCPPYAALYVLCPCSSRLPPRRRYNCRICFLITQCCNATAQSAFGVAAARGRHVTVRFHGQTVSTQTDPTGYWEAWLTPEPAGGPYTLTVSGDSTPTPIERKDILVGDVWLASGQSNMEFPLAGFTGHKPCAPEGRRKGDRRRQPSTDSPSDAEKSDLPVPLNEASDAWTECTPDTARHFSAVAYFFGREISERENVPVGLIDSTWGGTPAHSWISPEGLASRQSHLGFRGCGEDCPGPGACRPDQGQLRTRGCGAAGGRKAAGFSSAHRLLTTGEHGYPELCSTP